MHRSFAWPFTPYAEVKNASIARRKVLRTLGARSAHSSRVTYELQYYFIGATAQEWYINPALLALKK
jgi:hypothetical protein